MKNRLLAMDAKGFTLIELMIVVVILGILAMVVVPNVMDRPDEARQTKARSDIKSLETALRLFKLDNGFYPTTEQGLTVLRERPENDSKWDGPYLPKDIPLDPWGNPYVFTSPGEHGDYDIISYGLDGAPGGEGEDSDIVNWKNLGE